MNALADWIAETWSEAIRTAPDCNVWEFAEREIEIEGKQGNIQGPYRAGLTPYTKLFQEAATSTFSAVPPEDWWIRELLARGQRVDEVFVVKSSQSGFTQAALNVLGYVPHYAPGRVLYTIDSKEKAKALARVRLIPMLQKVARHLMTKDPDDISFSFIELANMIIELSGSFSSGIFSEKPLRYGFLDDVAYMVSEGGIAGMLNGTHVIDHMRSRFTTAEDSVLFVFSKPDLEGDEFIRNSRGGSQHSFHCRCPHCNERQVLEPEGLHYDRKECRDLAGKFDLDAVEALTTYKCAHCEKDIEEKWKHPMNEDGVFIPKSKEDRTRDDDPPLTPRRLSMRISDLNSPFPGVRWGKLARLKIEAEDNPAKLKYVVTNHWARPWREKAINLKAEQIRALCAGAKDPKTGKFYDADENGRPQVAAYKRGEIPFVPALIAATADRQGDKRKWILGAFKLDGTLAVVEYGACLGDSGLLELTSDPKAHNGTKIICLPDPDRLCAAEWGLQDSGFETFDVYDFCIAANWKWYPSKGVPGISNNGRLVEGKEDFYNGQPILRYHYHDHALKVHLYKNKIDRRTTPRLYLPSDVGDDFVAECLAESLQPVETSTGYKRFEWIHDKTIAPNDWPDALKMLYVVGQIILPQLQMDAKKKEIQAAKAAPAPAPPDPTPPPPNIQEKLKAILEDSPVALHYFNRGIASRHDWQLDVARKQGYIPATCLLGGALVLHEVRESRDPCAGCECPRAKCHGRKRSE